MKKLLAALVFVCAIAGAFLFWFSGSIDGLVRDAIANYGSAMTQARTHVEAVKIAPVDGKGTLSNLVIGNPPGFRTSHAMKVGRIDVEIDIASIHKNVVLVHRVAIHAPEVIYEKGEAMTNFDAIQRNIANYLGPEDNKQAGRKLIVEELVVRDAKAHASAAFLGGKTVSVPLPDITLRNLGKAKGGITPGELGQEVASALKSRLTDAVSFDRLMKSAGGTLDKAGARVKGLFK